MARKLFMFCVLLMLCPFLAGCWFLVGAAAGGATAMGVSPDSTVSHFDTSFDRAYSVSLSVIRSMGKTSMEDQKGGWIKAEAQNHLVAVHVEELTEKTVKVTVSARKSGVPKVKFAREIMERIANRLR